MSSESTRAGRHWRNEEGIALPTVLFAILAIGAIVLLMFASARFEVRATGQAAAHEAALHVADGGAEAVFGLIHQNANYATSDTNTDHLPPDEGFANDAAERAWVLGRTIADEARIETRNGFGYGIGPIELDGKRYVYGVGVIGNPDDPTGLRVVRTEINDQTGALAGNVILSNGDITFNQGGQATVSGSIHANCDLTLNQNMSVTGNATASCDYNTGHENVQVAGSSGGGYQPMELPQLDFDEFYTEHVTDSDLAWYDLCRTSGGQGQIRQGSADGPCDPDATVVATLQGNQSWNGWRYNDTAREFRIQTPHNVSGVFWAHQLNIRAANSSGEHNTLVATANPSDNGFTGNVVVGSNVHHYLTPWAIIAETDIDATQQGNANIEGLVYAGQQLQADGQFTLKGSMIVHDNEPSNPDASPVQVISFGGGGSTTMEYVAAYDIFASGTVQVFAWKELFR